MVGFGIFFNIFIMIFSTDRIFENGGEEVEAYVLSVEEEPPRTIVKVVDTSSFYYNDEITITAYVSTIREGDYTAIVYDGEEAMFASAQSICNIFEVLKKIVFAIAAFCVLIAIIKWLIFAFKVLILGVAVGSVANEVQTQENFNQKFYGNSEGRTVNPYEQQNYNTQYNPQEQVYNQNYNSQYNQQYPQNYPQQPYSQNNNQNQNYVQNNEQYNSQNY